MTRLEIYTSIRELEKLLQTIRRARLQRESRKIKLEDVGKATVFLDDVGEVGKLEEFFRTSGGEEG